MTDLDTNLRRELLNSLPDSKLVPHIPKNNGRRGPAVGEGVSNKNGDYTCIFVDGNDDGMFPAPRVMIRRDDDGNLKSSLIMYGPFEYLYDAKGVPFRGYF